MKGRLNHQHELNAKNMFLVEGDEIWFIFSYELFVLDIFSSYEKLQNEWRYLYDTTLRNCRMLSNIWRQNKIF